MVYAIVTLRMRRRELIVALARLVTCYGAAFTNAQQVDV
jgi:hypothetical protein